MASTDQRINLNALVVLMEQCLQNDAVDMAAYLEAYRSLYRFFCQLGTVFGFVASDVLAKITILEQRRSSEQGSNYATVQSMLEYEQTNELLTAKEPSGSRTLLRLHRAMDFIVRLLEGLSTLQDAEATSHVARKAYAETISQFHTWLIRKGALLAMYALPSMEGLVKATCVQSTEEFRQLIPTIVKLGRQIFVSTQRAYEVHDCLNLP